MASSYRTVALTPVGPDGSELALTLSPSPAATATEDSFFSSDSIIRTTIATEGSWPSDCDLSTAIASRCFFPTSSGPLNLIVDSAAVAFSVLGAGVIVPMYSLDPNCEFHRSIEEMVAALGLDLQGHTAHLHELLLCYLILNRKHAHKRAAELVPGSPLLHPLLHILSAGVIVPMYSLDRIPSFGG